MNMQSDDLRKFAQLADNFMAEAGLPFGDTPFGDDLCERMKIEELSLAQDALTDTMISLSKNSQADYDENIIKLTEIFAAVIVRESLLQKASEMIDVVELDQRFLDTCTRGTAGSFAKVLQYKFDQHPHA